MSIEEKEEELSPDVDLESTVLDSLEADQLPPLDDKDLPKSLHLFPLLRRPFFPGMATPIVVEPGPFYESLKVVAKSKHKTLGLVLSKKEDLDLTKCTLRDFYKVGVSARILRIIPLDTGGAQVILTMEKRIRIKRRSPSKYLTALIDYHTDTFVSSKQLKAYAISVISTIKELLKLNPLFKEELQIFLSHSDFTEPGKLADFAVALTTATRTELQDVLEQFDVTKRIDKSLILLKKEIDLSELQNQINQKIETTISKSQKEFFLREQLRTIKRELGIEKDDKACDQERFTQRIQKRQVPEEVQKVINEEVEKMNVLEIQSPEYHLSRSYLDWLTILPWGIYSEDMKNINHAERILNEDHHGLDDIKERILEFISVGKLRGGVKGNILCLAGPPGVGKTSIGKSIARALGRKFFRFSVGGMHDEAEIKGHRRTYIGAMPGKLAQALKQCQTMNPVIMLDEIDKIGNSYHGDPASALLEVLDPEQNKEFLDHYLDIRLDLSNVLFITTANVLDTIPEPLLDRMDILRLAGYITEEKIEIARQFLIPRNRKQMGLKGSQIRFHKEAVRQIIDGYARESGVRALEKLIKKIMRKVAFQIVKHPKAVGEKCTVISKDSLEKYLDKPIFNSDRFYDEQPPGVALGLAWTAMGGATLYIESTRVPSETTSMKLTGSAGDVMKESSQIAWTYLNSRISHYSPGLPFFKNSQVHIHLPEGATPKDGPSAGITIVTSLLSLLIDTPIKKDLGMTGELTLTGKVLAIGGVKEKLIASRRAGLKEIIVPKDNERDIDQLADYLKKDIIIHFVEHYDEVFKIAFPSQT